MPPRKKPGPQPRRRRSVPGSHRAIQFPLLDVFAKHHIVGDDTIVSSQLCTSLDLFDAYKSWIGQFQAEVLDDNLKRQARESIHRAAFMRQILKHK